MDNKIEQSTTEERVIKSLLAEHRSSRRWKNARFIIWLIIALTFLILLTRPMMEEEELTPRHNPYAALIRLNGTIMAGNDFSARKVIPLLHKAFKDKHAKGVVLLINSPGGSPVQASIIHDKIEQLKKKYHKTVIVVAQDALASGAYLVASAADKIYVNDDTVTGSIGVIMSGFGFKDAMEKLGITRRVFTAGTSKDRLDPFMSLNPVDVKKIKKLLNEVHQHFIDDVLAGRHGKLNGNPDELFSGDFWTGSTAVKLGLADGVANTWTAMQDNFGTTHYQDYSPKPPFWAMVAKDVSTELHIGLTSSHAKLEATL